MPLPKTPQRGDMARLEQLATGLKQQGGTHGPLLQRNEPGRPTGTTGIPAPRESQQAQGPSLPPDLGLKEREVAIAEWSRQYWTRLAAQFPSAYTQLFEQQADAVARIVQQDYYNSTGNFED